MVLKRMTTHASIIEKDCQKIQVLSVLAQHKSPQLIALFVDCPNNDCTKIHKFLLTYNIETKCIVHRLIVPGTILNFALDLNNSPQFVCLAYKPLGLSPIHFFLATTVHL